MANNKSEIIIRKAKQEDIPVILELIKELAKYEKLADQVTATEELLSNDIFGENRFVEIWLTEYQNKAAGYLIFYYNFSSFLAKAGLFIEDIFVLPEFRGKGIGKKLLFKVIELAKERDCGRVEWNVLDWNEPAISFYKKMGAKPLDEWTTFRITCENFDSILNN
ncbi:MAG: GNAT family N-acetyltransferase [Ignavibacteriaceae bacterium]